MIYLIGGSPRGGKSTLSRKLSKKLNISYLSTDTIRPILLPYFKEKIDKFFPFEEMFNIEDVDSYFKNNTAIQMLNAEITEAKTAWLGIENLIKHLLDCKIDYLIEGIYLLPNLVKKFKNENNIKIVFLIKLSEEKIYEGLLKNKDKGDWITDNVKNEKSIRLAAKSLTEYGKYFLEETKKYNLKCFNTEDNFHDKLEEAIKFLMQ